MGECEYLREFAIEMDLKIINYKFGKALYVRATLTFLVSKVVMDCPPSVFAQEKLI